MTDSILRIDNEPRDYAWGVPGGIARAFGKPAGDAPEAELWLGAHPLSPSRVEDDAPWPDLEAWEEATGEKLPYLLKLLAAASALSLQAHPTPDEARIGFDREEAAGIRLDARERNYKDPHAKPELIVAVDDGFEALCGFRLVDQTDALLAEFDVTEMAELRQHLAAGLKDAVAWLLSGDSAVDRLVAGVTSAAAEQPGRWPLVETLAADYPGDAGIALALLLNHVTLAQGECLWLPAGNIHAYLRGTGVELMGPSDNVLRGGLTPKHIDIAELLHVLDFTGGEPPVLQPIELSPAVVTYRPRSVASGAGIPFELLLVTGDARLDLSGPSIALDVSGAFDLADADTSRTLVAGDAVFLPAGGRVEATGAGRLFVATA